MLRAWYTKMSGAELLCSCIDFQGLHMVMRQPASVLIDMLDFMKAKRKLSAASPPSFLQRHLIMLSSCSFSRISTCTNAFITKCTVHAIQSLHIGRTHLHLPGLCLHHCHAPSVFPHAADVPPRCHLLPLCQPAPKHPPQAHPFSCTWQNIGDRSHFKKRSAVHVFLFLKRTGIGADLPHGNMCPLKHGCQK